MLGMDMMMKSLGINPDEIKGQIEKVALVAQEKINLIEMQLTRIEANQLLLYQLMARKGLIETVEEYNAACEREKQQAVLLGSNSHVDGKPN